MDAQRVMRGFATSGNGCMRVNLGAVAFTHIVLSTQGITFHWKEGEIAARMSLSQAANHENLKSVDGNFPRHDMLHFDEYDADFPDLHAHFLLNIVDRASRLPVLNVIELLTQRGFLTWTECGRIGTAILDYQAWE